MRFEFTPASRRVLAAAAGWFIERVDLAGIDVEASLCEVGPVEVLLGLLAEPEYRAAGLLAARGIDETAVRRSWPQVRPASASVAGVDANGSLPNGNASPAERNYSPRFIECLARVIDRLDLERNTPLATEHLLLALTTADDDVSRWLAARNLLPEALLADICARYGINPTPLSVEEEGLPDQSAARRPEPSTAAVVASTDVSAHVDAATEVTSSPTSFPAVVDSPNFADVAVLRVMDAAANRAGEALRVAEDYVRFVLDDPLLTRTCKELRHALAAALAAIPEAHRLTARATEQDVGTRIVASGEYERRDPADVAGANLRRLQESLRSLEEFAKLTSLQTAVECEQLRYRSYTLHKAVLGVARARRRLHDARLYVLVDGYETEAKFAESAAALVAAGVDVLQLRDKRLDDRTLLARARTLRRLTRDTRTLFVMNDRPDLALLSEADGVHVGQEELSVAEARRIVGPDRLVGVSTHDLEQARRAVFDGADYLGVGPTFPSGTKQFASFPGLEFVQAVAGEITLPAFAIGGITAENVGEVLRAGGRRIAVGGAVVKAADPATAAKQLRTILNF